MSKERVKLLSKVRYLLGEEALEEQDILRRVCKFLNLPEDSEVTNKQLQYFLSFQSVMFHLSTVLSGNKNVKRFLFSIVDKSAILLSPGFSWNKTFIAFQVIVEAFLFVAVAPVFVGMLAYRAVENRALITHFIKEMEKSSPAAKVEKIFDLINKVAGKEEIVEYFQDKESALYVINAIDALHSAVISRKIRRNERKLLSLTSQKNLDAEDWQKAETLRSKIARLYTQSKMVSNVLTSVGKLVGETIESEKVLLLLKQVAKEVVESRTLGPKERVVSIVTNIIVENEKQKFLSAETLKTILQTVLIDNYSVLYDLGTPIPKFENDKKQNEFVAKTVNAVSDTISKLGKLLGENPKLVEKALKLTLKMKSFKTDSNELLQALQNINGADYKLHIGQSIKDALDLLKLIVSDEQNLNRILADEKSLQDLCDTINTLVLQPQLGLFEGELKAVKERAKDLNSSNREINVSLSTNKKKVRELFKSKAAEVAESFNNLGIEERIETLKLQNKKLQPYKATNTKIIAKNNKEIELLQLFLKRFGNMQNIVVSPPEIKKLELENEKLRKDYEKNKAAIEANEKEIEHLEVALHDSSIVSNIIEFSQFIKERETFGQRHKEQVENLRFVRDLFYQIADGAGISLEFAMLEKESLDLLQRYEESQKHQYNFCQELSKVQNNINTLQFIQNLLNNHASKLHTVLGVELAHFLGNALNIVAQDEEATVSEIVSSIIIMACKAKLAKPEQLKEMLTAIMQENLHLLPISKLKLLNKQEGNKLIKSVVYAAVDVAESLGVYLQDKPELVNKLVQLGLELKSKNNAPEAYIKEALVIVHEILKDKESFDKFASSDIVEKIFSASSTALELPIKAIESEGQLDLEEKNTILELKFTQKLLDNHAQEIYNLFGPDSTTLIKNILNKVLQKQMNEDGKEIITIPDSIEISRIILNYLVSDAVDLNVIDKEAVKKLAKGISRDVIEVIKENDITISPDVIKFANTQLHEQLDGTIDDIVDSTYEILNTLGKEKELGKKLVDKVFDLVTYFEKRGFVQDLEKISELTLEDFNAFKEISSSILQLAGQAKAETKNEVLQSVFKTLSSIHPAFGAQSVADILMLKDGVLPSFLYRISSNKKLYNKVINNLLDSLQYDKKSKSAYIDCKKLLEIAKNVEEFCKEHSTPEEMAQIEFEFKKIILNYISKAPNFQEIAGYIPDLYALISGATDNFKSINEVLQILVDLQTANVFSATQSYAEGEKGVSEALKTLKTFELLKSFIKLPILASRASSALVNQLTAFKMLSSFSNYNLQEVANELAEGVKTTIRNTIAAGEESCKLSVILSTTLKAYESKEQELYDYIEAGYFRNAEFNEALDFSKIDIDSNVIFHGYNFHNTITLDGKALHSRNLHFINCNFSTINLEISNAFEAKAAVDLIGAKQFTEMVKEGKIKVSFTLNEKENIDDIRSAFAYQMPKKEGEEIKIIDNFSSFLLKDNISFKGTLSKEQKTGISKLFKSATSRNFDAPYTIIPEALNAYNAFKKVGVSNFGHYRLLRKLESIFTLELAAKYNDRFEHIALKHGIGLFNELYELLRVVESKINTSIANDIFQIMIDEVVKELLHSKKSLENVVEDMHNQLEKDNFVLSNFMPHSLHHKLIELGIEDTKLRAKFYNATAQEEKFANSILDILDLDIPYLSDSIKAEIRVHTLNILFEKLEQSSIDSRNKVVVCLKAGALKQVIDQLFIDEIAYCTKAEGTKPNEDTLTEYLRENIDLPEALSNIFDIAIEGKEKAHGNSKKHKYAQNTSTTYFYSMTSYAYKCTEMACGTVTNALEIYGKMLNSSHGID